MTVDDACATLGLAPSELSKQSIYSNYRERVKFCHPDKVKYPGAANEFKRVTQAKDTLDEYVENDRSDRKNCDDIRSAAVSFTFEVRLSLDDIWRSLSLIEKAQAVCFGLHVAEAETAELPEYTAFVIRSFRINESDPRRLTPLLISPVACRLQSARHDDGMHIYTLQPIETHSVTQYLTNMVASGLSVPIATQDLANKLSAAARIPVMAR